MSTYDDNPVLKEVLVLPLNDTLDVDEWSDDDVIISPCVHHNVLTSEIRIPVVTSSTSLTSLTIQPLDTCVRGGNEELTMTPTKEFNEKVHRPLAEVEPVQHSGTRGTGTPLGHRESVEDDEDEDDIGDNTVIVSRLQELVIAKNLRNLPVLPYGLLSTTVSNPLPPTDATCVKYKVHQSHNGVTTISIDPKSEPVTLVTPLPIIHHVINLPPHKMNSIRIHRGRLRRDRKLDQGFGSYDRSERLSQVMLTDYKVHEDRPRLDLTTGTIGSGGFGSFKSKVGSWYRRRVKGSVEQLSFDAGKKRLALRFPSFKCGLQRVNWRTNSDSVEASSVELDDGTLTDQRFVGGLACDQGQNEFEELRRVVKQGGDFCKDLAAVLQERSELEATYAKGLSKLSAKLLKASKEATGSVAHAWQAVAVQIDTQAELHRIWSTALLEEVAKPLRNSTETQHKIRKSVEVLVEKTTRNLAEWRIAEAKAKRQCFSSSKEFEKIQENSTPLTTLSMSPSSPPPCEPLLANNNGPLTNNQNLVLAEVKARSRVLSLPPPDKDPIKLEAKRRKAEEGVRRADIEYYTFCVRSERARLEWEGAIRNGSTCLRTLEEEKLGLLKDLAWKYYQHFNDFLPNLHRSSDSLEEPIKTCSVEQDMHSVVDIRRHAGSEQLLPDFYAEDISNLMKKERRMEALQKFLYVIKQDLERERKGATMLTVNGGDRERDTAHHDISDRLYYVKAMLLYLEGTRVKIENAVADQEGRQRLHASITQYMRHQRDKQGLPQTILKVPTWARDECLNLPSSSSSAVDSGSADSGSMSPDWRHDKETPSHDTVVNEPDDFDEFSSQSSDPSHEDVFEDTSGSLTSGPVKGQLASNTGSIEVSTLVPIPAVAPSIGQCRVIYDYDSNMFDELTIRTGELLNVHDKQGDGWWLGELNGQVGIFPATYVEEIV